MVGVALWDWFVGVCCGWVGGGIAVVDVLVAFEGAVIVGMGVSIVVCAAWLCGGVSIAIFIDTLGT